MRQVVYTPVFEGPDWATVTAGIKAKTPAHPQHHMWDTGIHAEPFPGSSHLWCRAVHYWSGGNWNPRNEYRLWERPKTENSRSQKVIPIVDKGIIPSRSNREVNVVWLYCCWDATIQCCFGQPRNTLNPEQQFRPAPTTAGSTTSITPPAPAGASEIQSYLGWTPTPWV